MSIPISDLIQIDIAISPNAVATDGFGPLVFMTKEFQPAMGEVALRIYTSKKAVDEDFPEGEIQAAATAWYSQKPTPKTFLVGSIAATSGSVATSGKLVGGGAAVLDDLKAITDGAMTIEVDGKSQKVTALDLSKAADLAAVATALEGKMTGVSVTQKSGVFTITSNTVGVKSSVAIPAATPLATALKLTTATGAEAIVGTASTSITSDLAAMDQAALSAKQSYFYVAIDRAYRDTDDQLDIAAWCESNGKVFGLATSNESVLKIGDTTNIFYRAKEKNLRNTINVFDASNGGDEYPEVSILGRASTVNFNTKNAVIVLAFKQGPTITTANLSSGQLTALRSYNGNAFIDVAGNVLFMDGKMADGTWFDTVQGTAWLGQKAQLNVFNLFYGSTTKIPWTETGVAMVNHQVTLALELGKTNGLIGPGYDNEGNFYPDGYAVYSTDLSLMQSQKGARIWEGTSFIAIGTGALQGAVISGTFVQ